MKVDSHRCHNFITKVDFSLLPAYVHIAWKICCKLLTFSRQMSLKLSNLQILVGFPPSPEIYCLELKILTNTYEGSYQSMVNIFCLQTYQNLINH